MDSKVLLEKDDDGYFVATVPALPGCISQGRTEKQVLKKIKEAIELHVHALAGDGLPLSRRSAGEARDQQKYLKFGRSKVPTFTFAIPYFHLLPFQTIMRFHGVRFEQ